MTHLIRSKKAPDRSKYARDTTCTFDPVNFLVLDCFRFACDMDSPQKQLTTRIRSVWYTRDYGLYENIRFHVIVRSYEKLFQLIAHSHRSSENHPNFLKIGITTIENLSTHT